MRERRTASSFRYGADENDRLALLEAEKYETATPARLARLGPLMSRAVQSSRGGYMTMAEFAAGDWIDRLAQVLPGLAEVQEPYLREYWEQHPRVHRVGGGRDGNQPAFPLDDLRDLYARAHHSHVFGEQEHYAPLLAALDPVRHILYSHPTLERVRSRIVGKDDFWMQIPNANNSTTSTNLIAGLMARAAELSRDRFRAAATELNAFLSRGGQGEAARVPGDLDVGYDAVLFWGLTLQERVAVADGMVMLPFEHVQTFVDRSLVEELAPPGSGVHRWRSVGAVVRPFRWKPMFSRAGYEREPELRNPAPFFQEAQTFLELLAVTHATPVLRLATLSDCIHRSTSRLLGLEHHNGGSHRGQSARRFDGFDKWPELAPEALAEAQEAFESRQGERYGRMAPIVGRLAEALARDGPFMSEDRILDVAISLERMYELDQGKISIELRERAASFLETSTESRCRVKRDVKQFYNVRSGIVHNRQPPPSAATKADAFTRGFEVARRSVVKLLRDGPPDWNKIEKKG